MNEYTQPEWNTETRRFYLTQNGYGQWWPRMWVLAQCGGWCPISIRDSNPFKTLAGAIRFVEKERTK